MEKRRKGARKERRERERVEKQREGGRAGGRQAGRQAKMENGRGKQREDGSKKTTEGRRELEGKETRMEKWR